MLIHQVRLCNEFVWFALTLASAMPTEALKLFPGGPRAKAALSIVYKFLLISKLCNAPKISGRMCIVGKRKTEQR